MDAQPQPQPVPPAPPAHAEATSGAEVPASELGIIDTARRLVDEGGDAARTALQAAQALKGVASAELALATTAMVRSAVMFVGAAIVALVGVFFVFGTLSAGLVALGLGWTLSLGISTLLLLLVAGVLVWRGLALIRMANFDATRRHYLRLRETFR